MIIAVDFDGTCVTYEFPNVGKDIGSAKILKKLTDAGHKLILFTMRSDERELNPDNHLAPAVNWFMINNIPLYGINENPSQKTWTASPKPYAQLYIDDAALGCPLKIDFSLSPRPFVDWEIVDKLFTEVYKLY